VKRCRVLAPRSRCCRDRCLSSVPCSKQCIAKVRDAAVSGAARSGAPRGACGGHACCCEGGPELQRVQCGWRSSFAWPCGYLSVLRLVVMHSGGASLFIMLILQRLQLLCARSAALRVSRMYVFEDAVTCLTNLQSSDERTRVAGAIIRSPSSQYCPSRSLSLSLSPVIAIRRV
jgi:hypothetical protein